jgi:hypothetical protein
MPTGWAVAQGVGVKEVASFPMSIQCEANFNFHGTVRFKIGFLFVDSLILFEP